jgi:RNA polymerase sigma-70 factor (ECF subfamily)
MKIWEHAGRWKRREAKAKSWIYRIAVNACLDRLRARRVRGIEGPINEAGLVADEDESAEDKLARAAGIRIVRRAVEQLPERQRLAVALCLLGDLSDREAAEAMATSVEAIESLLARARRSLKAAVESERTTLMEALQ